MCSHINLFEKFHISKNEIADKFNVM